LTVTSEGAQAPNIRANVSNTIAGGSVADGVTVTEQHNDENGCGLHPAKYGSRARFW